MIGKAPDNLLSVRDLAVDYEIRSGIRHTEHLRAVHPLTFSLDSGEVLGILGESGSGKSSLLRAIAFATQPATGSGIILDGVDVTLLPARRRRRHIASQVGFVFQDPLSSLNPALTVHEIVADPLRILKTQERAPEHGYVAELLSMVELSSDVTAKRPGELSGGQRQRVAIARALAMRPRILLADEPTASLDVSVRAHILGLLLRLKTEMKLAMIVVSHDVRSLSFIADRLMVMHSGFVVEDGPVERVERTPLHPYTAELLSAVPSVAPTRSGTTHMHPALTASESGLDRGREPGCPYRPRCERSDEACSQAVPPETAVDGVRRTRCFYPLPIASICSST